MDVSVELILQEKNSSFNFQQIQQTLNYNEKVVISKLTKVLRRLAILQKKELLQLLNQIEKISPVLKNHLYESVLPSIYFSKTINNYQLIKYHIDQTQSLPNESQLLEYSLKPPTSDLSKFIYDLAKFEWKLEITLTQMSVKKVLRPLVLFTIHTKQGIIKNIYLSVQQFQEIRKNIALVMRQIHQIELK
ncbi:hypothetical protein PPERSA_08053 [Pseudocohnilembus persalinus]|uniref:COMM domain-containing protein 5 n=1 Tax=Pseudocohnilembus persalinus TaxID=266149 RepID=A0A0V0R2K9_PSEPJ|nr:hypothetical protein PPERSA_08053 [Pseudocohnilembus persalinus]|eukprot:KRX08742.1 hypothetical protein PPERSA_08053 [Pseudocohnilembus persalinus]